MKIRITWPYCVAFVALLILCGGLHEFTHHLAVFAVCRQWGEQSFSGFSLPAGCENNPLRFVATAAGPIFTFALLWVGRALLRKPSADARWFGFTLIFANVPINRMVVALTGHNDEQWLARQLFGQSLWAYAAVVVVIWGVCLPPLVEAWRGLSGNRRTWWFLGFYILPFAIKALVGTFLEKYVLGRWHVMAGMTIGVPHIVLLVNAICFVLFAAFWRYDDPPANGAKRLTKSRIL